MFDTIVYFLNGICAAIVSMYCAHLGIKIFPLARKEKISRILFLMSIAFAVPFVLNIAWALDFIQINILDFMLIDAVLHAVVAILLSLIIYSITRNQNIIYFILMLIACAAGLLHSTSLFYAITSIMSALIATLSAVEMIHAKDAQLRKISYTTILYACVSVILLIPTVFGADPSKILWFASSILIFNCIYYAKEIIISTESGLPIIKAEEGIVILAAKFLFFIVAMNAFMLLSVISLHELGHALSAQYYSCEKSKAVIYDAKDFPHAEISCEGYYNEIIVSTSGVVLTIIISLLFLMLGSGLIQKMAYSLLGFSLFISYADLKFIGLASSYLVILYFFAILLSCIGCIKISMEYLKDRIPSNVQKIGQKAHMGKLTEKKR